MELIDKVEAYPMAELEKVLSLLTFPNTQESKNSVRNNLKDFKNLATYVPFLGKLRYYNPPTDKKGHSILHLETAHQHDQ